MRSNPRVSAIMPTCGRPQFAAQALADFEAQTYSDPTAELIVVDDVELPSFEDLPWTSKPFRYVRVGGSLTIGEKRNIAIAMAGGEVIVHWDDDDRYSADRIEHQVGQLIAGECDMVAYDSMEFEDLSTGARLLRPQGAPIGVSLCYWKRVWADRPFQARQVGEDNEFMSRRRIRVVPSGGRIVASIHAGNTSPRNTAGWISTERVSQ